MDVNYWIFQANPKRYEIVRALIETAGKGPWNWMVNQHKKRINQDDKFILWVGGVNAGVYALGTIKSSVQLMPDQPSGYAIDKGLNNLLQRVDLKWDYILVQNPITKSEIKSIEELKNRKYGLRGLTNITFSNIEYDILLGIAKSRAVE